MSHPPGERNIAEQIKDNENLVVDPSEIEVITSAPDDIRHLRGNRCGFGRLGHMLGFQNINPSRRIRVYYKVEWFKRGERGSWNDDTLVGPGRPGWIICSLGELAEGADYTLHMTGAIYE